MSFIRKAIDSFFYTPLTDHQELIQAISTGKIEQVRVTKETLGPTHPITQEGLLYAAGEGLDEAVKCLFHEGKGKTEATALKNAIAAGREKTVKLLLDLKVPAQENKHHCNQPIHVAAINNHINIVKLLVDYKAQLDSQDQISRRPASMANEKVATYINEILIAERELAEDVAKTLGTAIDENKLTQMRICCEKYTLRRVDNIWNYFEDRLQSAVTHENLLDLLRCLLTHAKMDVNLKKAQHDYTPLHRAISSRNIPAIRLLSEYKADMQMIAGPERIRPIDRAINTGDPGIMKTLVKCKASVNSVSPESKLDPLAYATKHGDTSSIYTLLELKADISKSVCLHQAAKDNKYRILQYLIDCKADVNTKNEMGQQPIHIATERKNMESIKLLCDFKANLNDKDKDGDTPLHYVLHPKDAHDIIPTIELLIEKKAMIETVNNKNQTIYDIVTRRNLIGWDGYTQIKRYFDRRILVEFVEPELELHLIGDIIKLVIAYVD